jgi:hypothetical protein
MKFPFQLSSKAVVLAAALAAAGWAHAAADLSKPW